MKAIPTKSEMRACVDNDRRWFNTDKITEVDGLIEFYITKSIGVYDLYDSDALDAYIASLNL